MAAGSAPLVSNPANLSSGQYVNPVIHADYSDPDVVAAPDGKTFYMTASSFQCAPGLPILKSEDLVNWTLVNHAIDAVPPTDFYAAAPRHGKGVWAPCIKYHGGEYFIYWGDPDFGIFMVKTDNPEGRWSEPVLVKAGKGMIDPTPLWDADGKAYLANAWAASRAGFNSIITISEMSPDGTKLISKPRVVFDGNDGVNHTIEGPKLYRRGDFYYILAPAGGVVDGWQLALRSRNIYGPYEARIVMAQGASPFNGPHQGAWVTTAEGDDWFVHFQDKGAYGRVIHLNPMEWREDWPVIGLDKDGDGCGDAVVKGSRPRKAPAPAMAKDLSPLFQWHANYADFFGFPTADAMMRVYGHIVSPGFVNLWEVPNLWLAKFPAEEFTVTSRLRVSAKSTSEGVSSGMVVMGWDYCRFGFEKSGDNFVLRLITCTDAEQGGAEHSTEIATLKPSRVYAAGLYPNLELDVWLRLTVGKGGVCRFAYSTDGRKFTTAPQSFTARAGKWIGAKYGFYSITPAGVSERGWLDVIDIEVK
ncbi:MAG: glycoside hydrolase 43 family protein [Muribaculaceae bacterium]|nr:glycoside hydrolase 43 family protein [Muribaculaceae bacterium]